ncbi:unnamed protein product [Schistosoma margrebowiei]|uniref:NADH dehydrogenase [ubiquinone] 1 alpha subcomplex subunit 9, mitochondrial n=1 Tax=Schistosoma margrebowiei TaxID=48269 RepID=A0A3P8DM86_9TREM|nr:unnamed protein product [Schistosoma margrebowiei]
MGPNLPSFSGSSKYTLPRCGQPRSDISRHTRNSTQDHVGRNQIFPTPNNSLISTTNPSHVRLSPRAANSNDLSTRNVILSPETTLLTTPRRFHRFQNVHIPLWARGKNTVKQPVCIHDLARGIVNSLHNPESLGQIYEAVGPHRYRLDDLVKARTYIYEHLSPNYSHLTFERLERESATDILSGCPTLDDLNVKLSKLEDHINHIVFLFRRQHFYWDALGEFPEPPPPPIQFQ